MSARTLKAPGVEIIEHDLSGYTTTNIGTGCLITGFAQKGEDLEPIKITNKSAWTQYFGNPTNEAEEYFYNAGMEVLNQGGFLHAAKIPYSNDMAGIYAASKFKISENRELLYQDDETGMFVTGYDEDNEPIYDDTEPNSGLGRFRRNYVSLKNLGINDLQLISPEGNDFISKDLVEEYETGESTPGENVIYLVDKTRAVYSRAVEVSEKQDNRDARACIGIVPVITTMCNSAWFQKNSTGVESDVDELYQPVRSLKTITFPAGAASAAEYKSISFTKSDLHTQLMKTDQLFNASLSELAANNLSCLVNGNLVDGKLKPFICNDVCVVVFKAYVSTEDGKIDFTPVETWVGSLDPDGRDEKGRTTFIDTIINNNSEYIYCFSNLKDPTHVLNPDHGFVAGSNKDYYEEKEEVKNDREYQAATLFSAYAARMLGFGDQYDIESTEYGLAAPRDFADETDEHSGTLDSLAKTTMGSLRAFYSQDARTRICTVDQLVYGNKYTKDNVKNIIPEELVKQLTSLTLTDYLAVSDKFITVEPTIIYNLTSNGEGESKGTIELTLSKDTPKTYKYEDYSHELKMGENNDPKPYHMPIVDSQKLSELTILNSTDYLRAIYDFENLVNPEEIDGQYNLNGEDEDPFDSLHWAEARQKCIQSLIQDSIEKSTRFKTRLRYLKKAQINIDKLDDAMLDAITSTNATDKEIGEKYIKDLWKSYNDTGLLSGIKWIEVAEKQTSTATNSSGATKVEAAAKDLEQKLNDIINVKTTSRKVQARIGKEDDDAVTFWKKYLQLKVYLNAQFNLKKADLLKCIAKIMEDCVYAQQRYVESKRNIDDSNIMLGFYPEMAEPIITYTTIAQSLNKIFDTMSNVHESDIDVVCDAGISNIAQFVKQVYDPSADDGEDVGGLYEPVRSSNYFKFNKNTDLAYWKTIVFKFDTFCKFRGDCMFVTEGPRNLVLIGNKQVVRKTKKDTSVDLNILPYLSKIAGFNTSYGAGYLNWYRTISDYTGDTLWVPPSIKAMGTYILTDKQYNWWDAPAGMRRGPINMVDVSFNPNKVQAGEIYDVNWNYAIKYLNDGIIQEGQKTFQTRQSALDRVNVRRLLGRIKRYVYFASRQFLYEPHTQAIREKYVKTITPFFQDLVTRGGLYDFKIICDSSNNTPEVIDRNELRVKIGIKPVKTIEFIIIDLAVLNTGASWTEMDSI